MLSFEHSKILEPNESKYYKNSPCFNKLTYTIIGGIEIGDPRPLADAGPTFWGAKSGKFVKTVFF